MTHDNYPFAARTEVQNYAKFRKPQDFYKLDLFMEMSFIFNNNNNKIRDRKRDDLWLNVCWDEKALTKF